MRISELFDLKKTQLELDFIDIDVNNELPLFLDGQVFSLRDDVWSRWCSDLIEDYFRNIFSAIKIGDKTRMRMLYSYLAEPNETCLGRSKNEPRGAFQGLESIEKIFLSFYKIQEKNPENINVFQSISDMKFYIEGVGNDTISDIVTNIIREPLLEYTKNQCELHGIPLNELPTKPIWNGQKSKWECIDKFPQLVINERKILFVPKNIVFREEGYLYKPQSFVQHDMLNFLVEKELNILNSPLIQRRSPKKGQTIGDPYVTKKSLRELYKPDRKEFILDFCSKYPEIMNKFKNKKHFSSLCIDDLFLLQNKEITDKDFNDFIDALISTLKDIPLGRKHANEYHKFITGLMTFLFYPSLTNPKEETPIDDKSKRIDITFINSAESGFFYELKRKVICNYIYVECKNYSSEISNPELDQLSGRYNHSMGKVGLLLCRSVKKRADLLKRISGMYRRTGNISIVLSDKMLVEMLNEMKLGDLYTHLYNYEKILFNELREIELENF